MVNVIRQRLVIEPTNGNINLHGRSGVSLTYRAQAAGRFLDISGYSLFFEINGVFRAALAPGLDVTRRLIVIPSATVAGLPLRQGVAFAVRDETNAPARVRWSGLLTVFGYEAQPA